MTTSFTQDLEKRLKEHNAGKSTYTKKFIPWKLIYREETGSKEIALKLEKYYKSSAGRRKIKKLLAPVAQQDTCPTKQWFMSVKAGLPD